jgi:RNA polymerase sigma factor (sigma-70 family)
MDVAQLIQQVRDGDDTSGPILVSVVAPRLLGYADLIAPDLPQVDREKAVEFAIETAIRRIDRYDSGKGTFPGWVRGFVRYAVRDCRRQRLGGAPIPLDGRLELAAPEPHEPETDEGTSASALAELVLTLPPADQLLLRLRFEEAMTHGQIAVQLGVSESACRKRLERILERFRVRAADDPHLSSYLTGAST